MRLKESGMWSTRPYGHCKILDQIAKDIQSTPTDYLMPTLNFDKNFRVSIPSRTEWENSRVFEEYDTTIYTDGSKMETGVGAGVYSERLRIERSFRLPNKCSVFQAEVLAIRQACKILKSRLKTNLEITNVAIFIDSQAAIKALDGSVIKSKIVKECRGELALLDKRININLIWIPGHSNFRGNEKADELARNGSTLHVSSAEDVDIPLGVMKSEIRTIFQKKYITWWKRLTNCTISRQSWPTYDSKRTKELMSLPRPDIARVIAVCTGHWPIGLHASRLGIPFNEFCRSCGNREQEESLQHFLCECPALAKARKDAFDAPFLSSLNDVAAKKIKDIILFLNKTNWL